MLLRLIDMCVKHITATIDVAMTKVCIYYIIVCPFFFVSVHCTLLCVHLL